MPDDMQKDGQKDGRLDGKQAQGTSDENKAGDDTTKTRTEKIAKHRKRKHRQTRMRTEMQLRIKETALLISTPWTE
ncbi:MAG: hypothetical protein ACLUAR_10700 [Pilosibacter sp.]